MKVLLRLGVALALVPLAASCIRYGGPSSLRRELSQQAGVQLDAQFALTVTRSGVALARKFVDEEDVPLAGVRRVEIGVYEVEGLRRGVDRRSRLELPELAGLTPLVVVHEEDADMFVLLEEDDACEIRQLVVVVAEAEEWVLVRLRGDLRKTIEQALRQAFAETERPDGYTAALAAYSVNPCRTDPAASAADPSRPSS